MIRLALLFTLWALPGLAQAGAERVHELVIARLGHMQAVAVWKWHEGVAVEDLEREAVVLDRAVAEATALGLPADRIADFYATQIETAKAIQFCWIDRFRTGAAVPPQDPPDLVAEIRPALLQLGAEINVAIAESDGDARLGALADLSADATGLACLSAAHLSRLADSLAEIWAD